MTESTPPREYYQLAIYPTAGRVAKLDDNTIVSNHQRTCLFVTLFKTLNSGGSPTTGVQFELDADNTTGGYVDFETVSSVTLIRDYPITIIRTNPDADPRTITGQGQLISTDSRFHEHPTILSNSQNRVDTDLKLSPLTSQKRTGLTLQFGTEDTEGGAIMLTPAQTTHLADILSEKLHGTISFTDPKTVETGVINPDGNINSIKHNTFTRGTE